MRAWVGDRLCRKLSSIGVRLRLWTGETLYASDAPVLGDLVVHDLGTLLRLAVYPDLYFGEAYMTGRLEVTGNLEAVLEAVSALSPRASLIERVGAWLSRPNSPAASRRNVHHHYDLGNDFYAAWLDEQLVYTCAHYERADMTLDEAQRAKLELVCRKLHLRRGETVVEAGCGWGALALHMAREHGVQVKAFNVSREQIAYARERARREGLSGQVEFIDDDYRNVTGQYDAFVSVGMLEHVGTANYGVLGAVIARTLRRHGRGLLHFIGRDAPRPLNPWIRRRIFPGGYTPTVGEVTAGVLMPAGMSVLDVENLRLHYARTLAHWAERFATAGAQVRGRYGEEFRRAWELYLAGSQAAFATGSMQLFQIVFAPTGVAGPYWSRAEMYGGVQVEPWFAATR
jgi:cyclopropane-fatty-acyl-phospholipid synthase